jgi:uncharacterized YigZ family protein
MPADPGTYLSINRKYGPLEIREKGSRFISLLYPVRNLDQVESIRKQLKKKYHDATHICWSSRLFLSQEESFRYDDDGEPSGTAGLPIYHEIKGREFFNALVAVIRYFGGVKLGTGGLARAYGRAAAGVLDLADPVVIRICQRMAVFFPFDFTGEMRRLIRQFEIEVVNEDFTPAGVHMSLDIPVSRLQDIERELNESSRGSVEMSVETAKAGEPD